MSWLCNLSGHAGRWSEARPTGAEWRSRCRRCEAEVVRSCRPHARWRLRERARG